jgi:L-alanine-DL-glutamate epimerase-like enolase superfamily enzyme
MPEGFTAFKNNIDPVLGVPLARFAATLTTQQLRNVARGYGNCREAVGDNIDIAVHWHNELDTPSAIAVAKAVEPMNPLFIEDALNPPFSEAWMALRRSTRVPLLTGEKLELVRGFKSFVDNQAVDIIHPDLSFAGGFTGTTKIADYSAIFCIPVAFAQCRLARAHLSERALRRLDPEFLPLGKQARTAGSLHRGDGCRSHARGTQRTAESPQRARSRAGDHPGLPEKEPGGRRAILGIDH